MKKRPNGFESVTYHFHHHEDGRDASEEVHVHHGGDISSQPSEPAAPLLRVLVGWGTSLRADLGWEVCHGHPAGVWTGVFEFTPWGILFLVQLPLSLNKPLWWQVSRSQRSDSLNNTFWNYIHRRKRPDRMQSREPDRSSEVNSAGSDITVTVAAPALTDV